MQTPQATPAPASDSPTIRHGSAWARTVLLAAAMMLLAGCASTLTAKVTRFNQWPADAAGHTYSFTAAEPARTLEVGAYQAQVSTELERIGLRAAPAGQTGRFVVQLLANMNERERKRLEPVYRDEWVWMPAYRDAQGRLRGGYWIPDPWGPRYVGDRQVTRTVQVSRLQVHITEPGTKRTVFEATALNEGSNEDLVEVVPYLVRAMFQDFPGANGQVRRLTFELPKD
jgi:Domain of unknown function (DUF4136)